MIRIVPIQPQARRLRPQWCFLWCGLETAPPLVAPPPDPLPKGRGSLPGAVIVAIGFIVAIEAIGFNSCYSFYSCYRGYSCYRFIDAIVAIVGFIYHYFKERYYAIFREENELLCLYPSGK